MIERKRLLKKFFFLVVTFYVVFVPTNSYAFFGIINEWAIEKINDSWPPISENEQQIASINESIKGLHGINNPSIALVLKEKDITPLLVASISAANLKAPAKIENLSVNFSNQQILFNGDVTGHWNEKGVRASGYIHGAMSLSFDNSTLILRPRLNRVQLNNIEVDGWWWLPSGISELVNPLINSFISNINGNLKPIEFSVLSEDILGPSSQVTIGSKIIAIPEISLLSSSALVTRSDFIALFEFEDANTTLDINNSPIATNFKDFKKLFLEKSQPLLSPPFLSGIKVSETFTHTVFGEITQSKTRDQRRTTAANKTINALSQIKGPDGFVFIPFSDIQASVNSSLKPMLDKYAKENNLVFSVQNLALRDQEIITRIETDYIIPEPYEGSTTIRFTISIIPFIEDSEIVLQPSIVDVSISKLKFSANKLDVSTVIPALDSILKGLTTGISEALPSIHIKIDPYDLPSIDLMKASSSVPGLSLEPNILPQVRLMFGKTAVRLSEKGLELLFDIESPFLPERHTPNFIASFNNKVGIESQFSELRAKKFNISTVDNMTAAISWKRIAELINGFWNSQGGIRAIYQLDTGVQKISSTQIELVERPNYSCKRDRKCSFESCANDCVRKGCNTDCTRRIYVPCPTWSKPLRQCPKSWDDPGCLAGKVACNVKADAQYGKCQLDCNTKANLKKADCDRLAEMEVLGCNLGREIQRFLAEVGGIGRIGGEVRAIGVVRTDRQAIKLSQDKPSAIFSPRLNAQLKIDGSLQFTPYDIGHLLVCPAKGKAKFRTTALVPSQQPNIGASVVEMTNNHTDGSLDLKLDISPFKLSAKLLPAPVDAILRDNPHLFVVCNPVLSAAVSGLSIVGKAHALDGDDLIKSVLGTDMAGIFTGDFEHELEGFSLPIKFPPIKLETSGTKFMLIPSMTSSTIVFESK